MHMLRLAMGSSKDLLIQQLTLPALRKLLDNDAGHRKGRGMGDGERHVCYPQGARDLRGAAVESDGRTPTGLANDLYLQPAHSVADSGTQSLGAGFFGGEPGGQALGRVSLAQAVCLLGRRVYTIEKTLAKSLHGLLNPGDFNQVDAASNDHAQYKTNTGDR